MDWCSFCHVIQQRRCGFSLLVSFTPLRKVKCIVIELTISSEWLRVDAGFTISSFTAWCCLSGSRRFVKYCGVHDFVWEWLRVDPASTISSAAACWCLSGSCPFVMCWGVYDLVYEWLRIHATSIIFSVIACCCLSSLRPFVMYCGVYDLVWEWMCFDPASIVSSVRDLLLFHAALECIVELRFGLGVLINCAVDDRRLLRPRSLCLEEYSERWRLQQRAPALKSLCCAANLPAASCFWRPGRTLSTRSSASSHFR